MSDFIKKLFSRVLSFFIGLFAGKKSQEDKPSIAAEKPAETQKSKGKTLPSTSTAKPRKRSGYFMELDEAEEMQPVNGNQQAKAAAPKTPEPVAAAKPAKPEPAKTPEPVAAAKPAKKEKPAKTPEPVAAAKPAKPEPAKTMNQAEATEAAAKVELVQTDVGVKVEPAKRESSSPAASTNGQSQTETTFAPKYLAPTSSSNRRRPGPNMNSFLDMARQVKTPG